MHRFQKITQFVKGLIPCTRLCVFFAIAIPVERCGKVCQLFTLALLGKASQFKGVLVIKICVDKKGLAYSSATKNDNELRFLGCDLH